MPVSVTGAIDVSACGDPAREVYPASPPQLCSNLLVVLRQLPSACMAERGYTLRRRYNYRYQHARIAAPVATRGRVLWESGVLVAVPGTWHLCIVCFRLPNLATGSAGRAPPQALYPEATSMDLRTLQAMSADKRQRLAQAAAEAAANDKLLGAACKAFLFGLRQQKLCLGLQGRAQSLPLACASGMDLTRPAPHTRTGCSWLSTPHPCLPFLVCYAATNLWSSPNGANRLVPVGHLPAAPDTEHA